MRSSRQVLSRLACRAAHAVCVCRLVRAGCTQCLHLYKLPEALRSSCPTAAPGDGGPHARFY